MKCYPLRLHKDQERRLLAGHLWIYGNEIDTNATPLHGLEPGQLVEIQSSTGRWLGLGYANPKALICARLMTRRRKVAVDADFIMERLRQALTLRECFYSGPWYRWVYGEADGLPGLVIDRYGSLIVLQFTTAGMERLREVVLAAVVALVQPQAILLRNDSSMRELEGLKAEVVNVHGTVADWVELYENDRSFVANPWHGQKTGWFYDQTANRAKLRHYVTTAPGRVLDACSYLGAWGISAAAWGATEVLCLDSSDLALEGVIANAQRNNCQERVRTRKGDIFTLLQQLDEAGERFSIVILDPPAFIKRRKDIAIGIAAYERLNRLGARLLSPGGFLITSSCSSLLTLDELARIAYKAARRNEQTLQWLESGLQGLDHHVHPAIAETAYLKTLYLRLAASC